MRTEIVRWFSCSTSSFAISTVDLRWLMLGYGMKTSSNFMFFFFSSSAPLFVFLFVYVLCSIDLRDLINRKLYQSHQVFSSF